MPFPIFHMMDSLGNSAKGHHPDSNSYQTLLQNVKKCEELKKDLVSK